MIKIPKRKIIISIWVIITIITALKQFLVSQKALSINDFLNTKINNYLIFKNVFFHTLNEQNLYAEYPNLYFDHNHYGPIFSIIIAPFALLPDAIGIVFWCLLNAIVLIYAITKLPLSKEKNNLLLIICLNEFITSILGQQFNPILTGMIILSFVFIHNEKDKWAALCIVLGMFIKIYGIVGLAFFFFSKHKIKFISWCIVWSIICFILPMLIASPSFIVQSYYDWFERLAVKNNENINLSEMQDISVMGMARKITGNKDLSNLLFIIPALFLFGLSYLKLNLYSNLKFRLLLLASVLIFTVIFSTGAESPTYIIAFTGVGIWFLIKENHTKWDWFLFILAVLLTSLSPTDIIPKYIRLNFIRPYALKALPCFLIWLQIVFELVTLNKEDTIKVENE